MIENDIKIRDPDIKDLEDIVHINRVCLPENYPIAYFIELIKFDSAKSKLFFFYSFLDL